MIVKSNRIVFLDILRGFALFGILYAHFVIWFTGSALPASVYQEYPDTPSMVAMAIFGTLVLGKFFSIFSFLFGAGFYFQKETTSAVGVGGLSPLTARFITLIVLGFIHHLFWRGDILMIYGVLGFGLLVMSNLSSRAILFWSVFFLLNVPGYAVSLTTNTVSLPMAEDADRHLWLMKQGSLSDFLHDNLLIFDNKLAFQLESGRLSRTFGFFLLGFFVAKQRWFTTERGYKIIVTSFRTTGRLLVLMCIVAATLFSTGYIWFDMVTKTFQSVFPLTAMFNLYNVLFSVFLIGGMFRLYHSSLWNRHLEMLYYPGEMAMSVYVMQTVIGLALFYPFGLHLFAVTTPAINALLVIPVFLMQVWACRWWLRRYQHGPLEWVTRQITRRELPTPVPEPLPQTAPDTIKNK